MFEVKRSVWLSGIPLFLFGIADRAFAILTSFDGLDLLLGAISAIVFCGWLILAPEQ